MTVFICLDDNNGQMFNRRRQSRDRTVTEDILSTSRGHRLYISSYSKPLLDSVLQDENTAADITVDDAFPETAPENAFCFAEDIPMSKLIDKTDRLIIYRWNRVYPKDVSLDIKPEDSFKLTGCSEFKGYSHEKITREVYER